LTNAVLRNLVEEKRNVQREGTSRSHKPGRRLFRVWFKGRFYSGFDITFAKRPDGIGWGGTECVGTYGDLGKKVWWAEVKLKSGQTGWVDMSQASLDGVDLLGSIQMEGGSALFNRRDASLRERF
jgi:hypothetical protein